jgi:predicted dehydrogenase
LSERTNKDVQVAILGCGAIAQTHIRVVKDLPQTQILGVCDREESRAQSVAEQFGIKQTFSSLSQMLDQIRPEVVHILTPPQTHAELTIQALKAGCHVFVEKPLCLTLEEVKGIYSAAQSTGRMVSVDHANLWSPLVQKARRVVGSGRIGRLRHIQYVIGDDYLEVVKTGYGRWALELRGGIFCDLISHPLYLIRTFLPDAEVTSVRACGTNIRDLHELWVDFIAEEAGANLWMSLSQRPIEHNLRIYCTRGTIHIDLRNFFLALVPERGLPGPVARAVNTISESWQRGMGTLSKAIGLVFRQFNQRAEIAEAIRVFYQAIVEGKSSPVTLADARAVVELSTTIWDRLERTSGAIRPTVDEKGRVIVQKTPTDFVRSARDRAPKVLVTGGTGFIGSHLVKRLVSSGRCVRVLCRPTSRLDALSTDRVELVLGDMSNLDSVRQAMKGIEVLYHLAAATGGD